MIKSNVKMVVAMVMMIVLYSGQVYGQMTTNSPFTRYGYGQIEDGGFSRTQSMGGTSIAIYSPLHINPTNPATYTSTDSTTFLFEVGVSGLLSNFKSGDATKNTFTGKLDYIALQSPITKWLGLSAGLIPFSYVGYNYSVNDSIELPGTSSKQFYTQAFQGNGGINQVYLGLTFNLFDYVTFGANGYYMFGNLTHYRTMQYSKSNLNNHSTLVRSQQHVNNFNVRFGLQYHQPIGKSHRLTFGAIYEFQTKLRGEYELLKYGIDTITAKTKSGNFFQMPQMFGVGVSYEYKSRLTVGADFTMYEFSKALFEGKTGMLTDRMKVAIGAEYIHNPQGRHYVDRMWWRLGANYRKSYIKIDDGQTNDFSITLGIGFPLKTSRTIIHFNMEYGNIGSQQYAKLQENYFKFGFSFSLNEMWFVKQKIR